MFTQITKIGLQTLVDNNVDLEAKVDLMERYIVSRDGHLRYFREFAGLHQEEYSREVIG